MHAEVGTPVLDTHQAPLILSNTVTQTETTRASISSQNHQIRDLFIVKP